MFDMFHDRRLDKHIYQFHECFISNILTYFKKTQFEDQLPWCGRTTQESSRSKFFTSSKKTKAVTKRATGRGKKSVFGWNSSRH